MPGALLTKICWFGIWSKVSVPVVFLVIRYLRPQYIVAGYDFFAPDMKKLSPATEVRL